MADEKTREERRKQDAEGERPIDVTEENRPPGDPGGDVDIQEYVGGQPGRPDPGATGGPSHEAVHASDARDEPAPSPDAGNHRLAGLREDAEDAPAPDANREADPRAEGDAEFGEPFREKTEREFPEDED